MSTSQHFATVAAYLISYVQQLSTVVAYTVSALPGNSRPTNSSPVSRLPPEVLGHIFFLTLPLVDPRFLWNPPHRWNSRNALARASLRRDNLPASHHQSPWVLGQVCRHWRELTVTDQRLWSSWLVVAGVSSFPQIERHLERSRPMTLHVALGRGEYRNPAPLAAAIRSSERWGEATICIDWPPRGEGLHPLLWAKEMKTLKGHVGNLHTLYVCNSWLPIYEDALDQDDDCLTAFAVAPALRNLIVDFIRNPILSVILPWHQLTRYQGIGETQDQLRILTICPNLVEADLTFPPYFHSESATLLRMEHLQKLYVSDPAFLKHLALPALQEIVADKQYTDADDEEAYDEDDALLPLLMLTRRDNPPLSSISLRRGTLDHGISLRLLRSGAPISPGQRREHRILSSTLLSLVEHNSALQCLRLHICMTDILAFDDLIARLSASPGFAPTLRAIAFEICGKDFDHDEFMNMVEARRRASLHRVALAMSDELAANFWAAQTPRVATLRRAGLYFWVDSFSAKSPDSFLDESRSTVAASWRDVLLQ
ncbi:hypothetical protein DFH06DRAFT_1127530 [Mycena polygramma]|nr:hypothetical protein DFH06DRAFT_1127530 [Mycena polygramma]